MADKIKVRLQSRYFSALWLGFALIISACSIVFMFAMLHSEKEAEEALHMSYSRLLVDEALDVRKYVEGFYRLGETYGQQKSLLSLAASPPGMRNEVAIQSALKEANSNYSWNAAYPYKQVAFLYLRTSGLLLDVVPQKYFVNAQDVLPMLEMSVSSFTRLLDAGEDAVVDTIWDGTMANRRLMLAQEITRNIVFITGISDSHIMDMMETSQLPDGAQVMLLTQGGQDITYANDNTAPIPCPYAWEDLPSLPEIGQQALGGRSFYVYHSSLMDGDLQQVALIPADAFSQASMRGYFPVIALLFMAGVPLSFILAWLLSLPVQKVADRARRLSPCKTPGKWGEISLVENAMEWLEEQKNLYQDRLADKEGELKKIYFLRTLKGEITLKDAFISLCRESGFESGAGKRLVLFSLRMDDRQEAGNTGEILQDYLKLEKKKMAGEKLLSTFPHIMAMDGRQILGLLEISADEGAEDDASADKTDETVRSLLSPLQETEAGDESLTCSLLISRSFLSFDDLPYSYSQLMELIQDMAWTGDYDTIRLYDDFQKDNARGKDVPDYLPEAARVSSLIREGAFKSAAKGVRLLSGALALGGQHFYKGVPLETSCLMAVLSDEMDKRCQAENDDFCVAYAALGMEKLFKKEPSPAVLLHIAEGLEGLAPYAMETGAVNSSCIDKAVDYIRSHFTDPGLSAAECAEVAGMPASTFSKAFRQTMDVSYLEYVHRMRIEKAKEWLREGKLSLQEVAEKSGYSSTVTMNRAFKRYENTTPGRAGEKLRSQI